MEMNEYNRMLELINSVDNLDDMLFSALSGDMNTDIKISDENGEKIVSYDTFLKMFDEEGLAAFC